jgi:hypothetical protein
VHKKTLGSLEFAMTEYDLINQHSKGADMPRDYFSINVLFAIDVFAEDLLILQQEHEFAQYFFSIFA